MKTKAITLSLMFAILILSVGCSGRKPSVSYEEATWDVSDIEGVSVDISDITTHGVTATLNNTTENDYTITGWMHIQTKKDNVWYEVKQKKDIVSASNNTEGYSYCDTLIIDWTDNYGELPKGEYRIGVCIDCFTPHNTQYSVWGYFPIE